MDPKQENKENASSDADISRNTSGLSGLDNKHIFDDGKDSSSDKTPTAKEIEQMKQDTKGTGSAGSGSSNHGR